jgi:hypothetical protein
MHAALWIAAIATGLLATGVLYERIGDWRDRRRYAGSGRWVPIANGAKLYLFELGTGEPTVLFEAGIGATHLNWRAHSGSDRRVFARTGRVRSLRSGLEQPLPHSAYARQRRQ